ncbi:MAG TPA: hypothetical protein VK468_12000 [Pyrinomonadaceae bacterium]|nr:hypothetical protein [Pyrinomonadaceae bacterium]
MSQTPFAVDSTILIMHLVREVIITLIAGFIAALVARENSRSTLGLGILLLLVGILVEATAWNYLPIWYHLIFLVLLIPVTIAGGKLRKTV